MQESQILKGLLCYLSFPLLGLLFQPQNPLTSFNPYYPIFSLTYLISPTFYSYPAGILLHDCIIGFKTSMDTPV